MKTLNINEEINKMVQLRKDSVKKSFAGLSPAPHRLETVANKNGVQYINDSKATDVDSTWFSLEVTEGEIIWIVGGVDKGNDYLMLKDVVKEKVKCIICFGQNNDRIFQAFQYDDPMMLIDASSMDEAVHFASILGCNGDKVLLSPASPSYDLFKSFEDRGNQFTNAVNSLA